MSTLSYLARLLPPAAPRSADLQPPRRPRPHPSDLVDPDTGPQPSTGGRPPGTTDAAAPGAGSAPAGWSPAHRGAGIPTAPGTPTADAGRAGSAGGPGHGDDADRVAGPPGPAFPASPTPRRARPRTPDVGPPAAALRPPGTSEPITGTSAFTARSGALADDRPAAPGATDGPGDPELRPAAGRAGTPPGPTPTGSSRPATASPAGGWDWAQGQAVGPTPLSPHGDDGTTGRAAGHERQPGPTAALPAGPAPVVPTTTPRSPSASGPTVHIGAIEVTVVPPASPPPLATPPAPPSPSAPLRGRWYGMAQS